MTINDPEVMAELEALYPEYEQALVTNDVEKLVEMFWAGQQVMRFGATENLVRSRGARGLPQGPPCHEPGPHREAARNREFWPGFSQYHT